MTGQSERARRLRREARQLRMVAERLMREADQLDLAEGPVIGGAQLVAEAEAILREREAVGAASRGIHYKDLAALVEERTGKTISGLDAGATLLANIQRSDRIEPAQGRSGRYRVAVP